MNKLFPSLNIQKFFLPFAGGTTFSFKQLRPSGLCKEKEKSSCETFHCYNVCLSVVADKDSNTWCLLDYLRSFFQAELEL